MQGLRNFAGCYPLGAEKPRCKGRGVLQALLVHDDVSLLDFPGNGSGND
jgi:hypothetical protein